MSVVRLPAHALVGGAEHDAGGADVPIIRVGDLHRALAAVAVARVDEAAAVAFDQRLAGDELGGVHGVALRCGEVLPVLFVAVLRLRPPDRAGDVGVVLLEHVADLVLLDPPQAGAGLADGLLALGTAGAGGARRGHDLVGRLLDDLHHGGALLAAGPDLVADEDEGAQDDAPQAAEGPAAPRRALATPRPDRGDPHEGGQRSPGRDQDPGPDEAREGAQASADPPRTDGDVLGQASTC